LRSTNFHEQHGFMLDGLLAIHRPGRSSPISQTFTVQLEPHRRILPFFVF
jgi:hypothetical protein